MQAEKDKQLCCLHAMTSADSEAVQHSVYIRAVKGPTWCKRCSPESLGLLECIIIEHNIINCARLSLLVILMLGLTQ